MRHLLMQTIACCLMSACASGPPPTTAPEIVVPPQASLTTPPARLPLPASGRVPDLEANHRQVARQYHLLAARYCGLLAYLGITHNECRRYETAADE